MGESEFEPASASAYILLKQLLITAYYYDLPWILVSIGSYLISLQVVIICLSLLAIPWILKSAFFSFLVT